MCAQSLAREDRNSIGEDLGNKTQETDLHKPPPKLKAPAPQAASVEQLDETSMKRSIFQRFRMGSIKMGKVKPIYAGAQVAIDSHTFIPLSRFALLERLKQKDLWIDGEFLDGQTVMELINNYRHLTYMPQMGELERAYLPFSPDSDTKRISTYTSFQKDELRRSFFTGVETLLTQANYAKLEEEQLNKLLSSNNPYGLNLVVDLEEFDNVEVFFRGNSERVDYKRDWRWLFLRKRALITPIFQRLFLAFKLKPDDVRLREIRQGDDLSEKQARKELKRLRSMIPDGVSGEQIYLKLFKDFAQDDLEMMFPNTKVAFKMFDKIKLGVTAGGGTVAGVASTLGKLLAVTNPIALATGLFGLIGLITRQVMKFFNQRNQYMMVLAQNLYFHNLANNRGALALINDRAEEEDVKEEVLLYNCLVRSTNEGMGLKQAQSDIEALLKSEFEIDVQFDMDDALSRLIETGIVIKDKDERLEVLPPREARKKLEAQCHSFFDQIQNDTARDVG